MLGRARAIAHIRAPPPAAVSEAICDGKNVLACPICGGVFGAPTPRVGEMGECGLEVGGCGAKFRLTLYATKPAGEGAGGQD